MILLNTADALARHRLVTHIDHLALNDRLHNTTRHLDLGRVANALRHAPNIDPPSREDVAQLLRIPSSSTVISAEKSFRAKHRDTADRDIAALRAIAGKHPPSDIPDDTFDPAPTLRATLVACGIDANSIKGLPQGQRHDHVRRHACVALHTLCGLTREETAGFLRIRMHNVAYALRTAEPALTHAFLALVANIAKAQS